MLVPKT